MTHWSDAWLGRPYHPDEYNCSHFLVEVLAAQFGRDLDLPPAAASLRARDRQVAAALALYCRPRAGAPVEGDITLTIAHGRRAEIGHHSGVLVYLDGRPAVLHCLAGMGACRHRLDELPARGMALDGIFEMVR